MFNVVDLFSGAGGMATGSKRAGFNTVFATDFVLDMCKTFELNHPEVKVVCKDVKDFSDDFILKELKPLGITVVCGGPPCQGFSTVGQKNEADPRNSLFLHFFRFVDLLSPDFVVFENVSGFRRLYNGRVFNAVCDKLNDLGYSIEFGILNAAEYGVPQIRRRTIIVGYKNKYSFKMPKPILEAKDFFTLDDALGDLPKAGEIEYKKVTSNYYDRYTYQADRRGTMTEVLYHEAAKHGEKLLETIKNVPYGGTVKDIDISLRPNSCYDNTYSRLWWHKPSTTITSNFGTPSSSRCIHPFEDRALTAREACRLQSFDDNYKFHGGKGSIHLQIGNAVPPILAEHIFNSIRAIL